MGRIKIYGASDDLIEIEGKIEEEFGKYGTEQDRPALLVGSDGTILSVYYGKNGEGIWSIIPLRKGEAFVERTECLDADADTYSDVIFMDDEKVSKFWFAPEMQSTKG